MKLLMFQASRFADSQEYQVDRQQARAAPRGAALPPWGTHLGGDTADPAFARQLLLDAAERLCDTGYEVWIKCKHPLGTPFGWICTWELAVYGEALAKVFKGNTA
jgi:hypothetical protein